MGLDMYLKKKIYIGAKFEHLKVKGVVELSNFKGPIPIKPERISEIVEEVGYWRKANQIHKWFVDNVQDGEDECKEYYVASEKLIALRDLCKKAIETKDASILPPQAGFFFGGTEIDEYYWQDLEETIVIIESIEDEFDTADFYYRASW